MNRLTKLLGAQVAEATLTRDNDDAAFCSSDHGDFQYSTFVPLHYERNYAYPLLIWLHGGDDNEMQLRQVMPHVSLRNYVAISPRGGLGDGSGLLSETYCWQQDVEDIQGAEDQVLACVDIARRRFHIAPHRIFLAGYDCGGTMALRIAFRCPQLFAGVASLNGPFPLGHHPLLHVNQARRLPVLLAQGRQSDVYSEDQVCDDLRLLHTAGLSTTLRQYPCGDELTTRMLGDLDHWIMERVTGTVSQTEESWSGSEGSGTEGSGSDVWDPLN